MERLYARFQYPNRGYRRDGDRAMQFGLVVGERYLVDHISMGQSNTSVYLVNRGVHNSVLFDFENEDGSEHDIFGDPKYNPYIKG